VFDRTQDTIVAISTAVGASARGIVRFSGPSAIELASETFAPRPIRFEGFRRYAGTLRWIDEDVDVPAELYVFRAPISYTRQDMAEVHTIGCPPLLAALLDQYLRAGARLAEPGEFTGRAFLAGAMDLTAVEGVAAVIHAGSDAQLRAAGRLLNGSLRRQTEAWRDRLMDLLSLVEASIDFVDEPIEFLSPGHARHEVEAVRAGLRDLLDHSLPMERVEEGFRVALLGPPNAGKSTLFNRLAGLDRAICSPLPGTTRDLIAAPLRLAAGSVWLLDAAGIGAAGHELDAAAQRTARQAAESADAVLLVLDATAPGRAADDLALVPDPGRAIVVLNKIDLVRPKASHTMRLSQAAGYTVVPVSARTGEGCEALVDELNRRLDRLSADASLGLLFLNARHRSALNEAWLACDRACDLIGRQSRVADAADLIALELREAVAALSAITGAVATEEVLERIFARFCIGK